MSSTDPAEIVPDFLYLGSLRSAADLYILHDLHITRIGKTQMPSVILPSFVLNFASSSASKS
jgi:hypothetical protein